MTAMRYFILCFAGVGVLFPTAWFAAYHLVPGFSSWWLETPAWTGDVLLAVWPGSILLLGDPQETSLVLPIVSTALNAVLYAMLGALFWIGLRRSKIVLVATVLSILAGWYGLLSL